MFRFSDAQYRYLYSLYDNETLADARFYVMQGNQRTVIHAHKVVMSISSRYARTMFSGEMKEARTGEVDMTIYDAEHVRLCIKYAYRHFETTQDIKNLLEANPEQYGSLAYLVNYMQIDRLQVTMEEIAASIFARVYMLPDCRAEMINSIINCPGNNKGELARKFVLKLHECYNKLEPEPETASEFINFMLTLDTRELTSITKLGVLTPADNETMFILWSQRYSALERSDSAGRDLDIVFSKGYVRVDILSARDIIAASALSMRGTLTFNWIERDNKMLWHSMNTLRNATTVDVKKIK